MFQSKIVPEDIYVSLRAHTYKYAADPNDCAVSPTDVKFFHHSLPDFNVTPLYSIPSIASSLKISTFMLKAESSRLGLPAFKILGASWGAYCAICDVLGQTPNPIEFSAKKLRETIELHEARDQVKQLTLFAATDGNHGRAVARMASMLLPVRKRNEDSPRCVIYVPTGMYEATKKLIEEEGAKVVTVDGDYDEAVKECWHASRLVEGGVMVQDNAFDGYEVVPMWIVEGYQTLLEELDQQFLEMGGSRIGRAITHVVTPIGVGSLGHAVVKWAKHADRTPNVRVMTVEPETAGCLNVSLRKGENTTIETIDTIMSGMCCGTVSPISWKSLRDGIDCSVTISDWEAHRAVLELGVHGIDAGPCGAGCLAGLRKALDVREVREQLEIDETSAIVVLCTEGKRQYPIPEKPYLHQQDQR